MSADPKTKIQTQYFSLLNGNVTLSGQSVPVYDFLPASPSFPYIRIGEYTETDDSDKTSFGEDLTVTVQVVDRVGGSGGSRANLFSVIDQVKGIICTRPVAVTVSGFNVLTATLESETTFRNLTDTHLYFYSSLRFRHKIEQS